MLSLHHRLTVSTGPGIALHDITPQLRALVADSGMATGFLTLTSRHTTTAITINENEERLLEDVRRFFTRLAPPDDNRVAPVDNFMIYKDIIRLDRPD